jgi:hypothetical protein
MYRLEFGDSLEDVIEKLKQMQKEAPDYDYDEVMQGLQFVDEVDQALSLLKQ